MAEMDSKNFVVIQGWMCNELKLKAHELIIFALIYGFTQDGITRFKGSRGYIANTFNITLPTVDKALAKLVDKGYISLHTTVDKMGRHNEYWVSKEILLWVGNNLGDPPGKETLHRNIDVSSNNNSNNNYIVDGSVYAPSGDVATQSWSADASSPHMPTASDDKGAEQSVECVSPSKHSEIMEVWNSIPNVTPIISIKKGSLRYKSVNARLREYSMKSVMQVLENVKTSDYLQGQVVDWRADFDWVFKPNNFIKVLEGKYNKNAPREEETVEEVVADDYQ